MVKKIIAVTFIYLCTVIAWVVLGGTIQFRTYHQDEELKRAVGQLWGTVQIQQAPYSYYQVEKTVMVKETTYDGTNKVIEKPQVQIDNIPVPLEGSQIHVDLQLEHRRKGLLWYATYRVNFKGQFQMINPTDTSRKIFFELPLPSSGAVYDNFKLSINGQEIKELDVSAGSVKTGDTLLPGQTKTVEIAYGSQGMDQWWYSFGTNVTQIRNFSLTMTTDFDKIDFPQNSISPTSKEKSNNGWQLQWKYSSLLSGVQIGMDMPKKLNPGPWASKITYFAPVSLFLFFFLLLIFTTLKDIKLHSMHFFFLGCSFFSYHLLLAYIVDHVSIHVAFWVCSAVSIILVISYMRIIVGPRFAFLEVGVSQLVFLVLFSYTFFFEGYTGLAVTIMCIVTLFIVMQMTARLDWEKVFQSPSAGAPLPPNVKVNLPPIQKSPAQKSDENPSNPV